MIVINILSSQADAGTVENVTPSWGVQGFEGAGWGGQQGVRL